MVTMIASSAFGSASAEPDFAIEAIVAEPEFEFAVLNARLPRFVETLKIVSGERIELTDAVRGRIQRARFEGSISEILAKLAAKYELDMFYFNGVYYLSLGSEATSRVVRLGNLSTRRAEASLEAAGLGGTSSLQTLTTPDDEALVMSGPPKLLAFAEILIESIPNAPSVTKPIGQIRVRRGIEVTNETIGGVLQPPNAEADAQTSEKQEGERDKS